MENKKRTFREIIRQEKEIMLPLNFFVSYILTPIYAIISLVLITVFGVLMSVDEDKYLISGILCLCAFVVVSIIFLSTVPFVRKKAIQTEIQRYDFDFSDEPDLEIWDFSTEEIALRFKSYGMYVDDDFYNFDELMITIETSNYCKRVHIVLRFMINPDTYITLPIDKRVLKMIDSFRIRIYNRSQLDYILDNKTIAFEEIYNRGHVSFPPR
ncbi:MAG: hypothetical protein IJ004_04280 [Clostridia bacterium]|nr:hypothetical protein [Clostridia bacterium]